MDGDNVYVHAEHFVAKYCLHEKLIAPLAVLIRKRIERYAAEVDRRSEEWRAQQSKRVRKMGQH
jgi:hypothetical protein